MKTNSALRNSGRALRNSEKTLRNSAKSAKFDWNRPLEFLVWLFLGYALPHNIYNIFSLVDGGWMIASSCVGVISCEIAFAGFYHVWRGEGLKSNAQRRAYLLSMSVSGILVMWGLLSQSGFVGSNLYVKSLPWLPFAMTVMYAGCYMADPTRALRLSLIEAKERNRLRKTRQRIRDAQLRLMMEERLSDAAYRDKLKTLERGIRVAMRSGFFKAGRQRKDISERLARKISADTERFFKLPSTNAREEKGKVEKSDLFVEPKKPLASRVNGHAH